MKRLKISLPTGLSPLLAFGIVLAVVLFAMGGGIFYLVNSPSFTNPSGTSLVNSSLQDQYGIEMVLSIALIFVGFVGFLLIYESTKHVYNASYATKLLWLGIVMIAISVILLHWMMISKATWLYPWAR